MKKLTTLCAATAMIMLAMPAKAAPVEADPKAKGHALILIPLTLERLDDLDFGTVVSSSTAGTVTIPADGSARSQTGGVTLVASDPGLRARFGGAGTVGQQVVIALPATPFNLVHQGNGTDTVTVTALTLDGPATRTIDATAAYFFHVGGTLSVAADQMDGVYEAEFDVTADYQ